MEAWAKRLLAAVEAGGATFDLRLQAIRVNEIVIAGMNVETFFETGLACPRRSPFPDTFVLGYTNGSMAYLPRAEDHPEGGWKLGERYALPDQLPQFYPGQVTALHPDSEQRALEGTLELIRQVELIGGREMGTTLYAGAARRAINPQLGTGMAGLRLFGSPIQAIESDLTGTVLVLGDGDTKVAVVAIDLCVISMAEAGRLRSAVAEALRTPVSHVLLNLSHVHSSPALPEFMAMTDTDEDVRFRTRYERDLEAWLVEAAMEADGRLQPARIGCAWGESTIGVYRRETRDGRDVLGEVPDRPIDTSVGVIRVDDLDGGPIAVIFRYSAHPVTVGSRSQVASPDYPGPARDVLEAQSRRPRPLPPGLRRQHQPPRRNRLRSRLPRHQEPRRPRARRRSTQDRRRHPHQHPRGRTPTARQRPQHPLHPVGARRRRHVHPPRRGRDDRRPRVRRAALAREGPRDPRPLAADA